MAGTITHKWNGSVLTITSDSGISSVNLLGPKGDDGARGPAGPAGTTAPLDTSILDSYATKTYVEENAAPAGHGLGWAASLNTYNGGDLNTLTANGWYFWDAKATINIAGIDSQYWYIHIIAYGDGHLHCKQEINPATRTITGRITRKMSGGTWGEWEWENPPLSVGVEYRTTEKVDGNKAVYKMRVKFGALPNNTEKSVALLPANVRVIDIRGHAEGSTYNIPIIGYKGITSVGTTRESGKVWIATNMDMSSYTAYLTISYCKD